MSTGAKAAEGCVRETWGALVALHQAARAADAPLDGSGGPQTVEA